MLPGMRYPRLFQAFSDWIGFHPAILSPYRPLPSTRNFPNSYKKQKSVFPLLRSLA
jgi:hypothetical protein